MRCLDIGQGAAVDRSNQSTPESGERAGQDGSKHATVFAVLLETVAGLHLLTISVYMLKKFVGVTYRSS